MDDATHARIERHVTRVLLEYAHSVDRRDYDGIARCYWDDARDERRLFSGDAVAYVAWLREVLPGVSVLSHQFTNILVWPESETVATSETYCLNVLVYDDPAGGPGAQTTSLLRYLDRFECRDGAWRIADRRVVMDWTRVSA